MAYTKKTTKKVETINDTAQTPSAPAPVEVVKETPKRPEFGEHDGIMCRSITPGTLVMNGMKSNIGYVWNFDGDKHEIEYADLVAAVRSNSPFVSTPYFIIEDEDFLTLYPDIKKSYEALYSVKDLKNILKMSPFEMEATIAKLPEGAKNSILGMASEGVKNGTFDSISRIKTLNKIFGVDLLLLAK